MSVFDFEKNAPYIPETSDPSEFYSKLSAGKIGFSGDVATLIDPRNKEIFNLKIDSPNFLSLSKGLRPLTDSESKLYQAKQFSKTPIGTAAAAAAGAARGATFNLSDIALSKSGLVSPETLEGLQLGAPIASGVGEIASGLGSIAKGVTKKALQEVAEVSADDIAEQAIKRNIPLEVAKNTARVVSTPARLADEGSSALGRAVASKVEGKIKQAAVQGVVQGASDAALYRASEIARDSELNRQPDLSAEAILADIGLTGLIGGIVGGASLSGYSLLKDKTQKIPSTLTDIVDDQAQGDISRLAKENGLHWDKKESYIANALGLKIPQIDALSRPGDRKGAVKAFKTASKEIINLDHPDGQKVILPGNTRQENAQRFVDSVDDIGKKLSDTYKKLSQNGAKSDLTPSQFSELLLKEANSKYKGKPFQDKYISTTDDLVSQTILPFNNENKLSAADLTEIKNSLLEHAKAYARSGNKIDADVSTEIYKSANVQLEILAGNNLLKSPQELKEFTNNKKLFAQLFPLAKATARRSDMVSLHDPIGLIDTIRAGSVADYMGLASSVANSGDVSQAGALGASMMLRKLTEKTIGAARDQLPGIKAISEFQKAGLLKDEAERKAKTTFARVYKAAKRIGSENQRKVSSIPYLPRASSLIANLFSHSSAGSETEERKTAISSDSLQASAANPAFTQRLDQSVTALYAPQQTLGALEPVAQASTRVAQAAYQSLLENAPVASVYQSPSTFFTPDVKMVKKWSSSNTQSANFLRVAAAIEDPVGEIERAGAGDLNLSALSSVKRVYPEIYSRFAESLADSLRERKEPLTLQQRSLYRILLDGTLNASDEAYDSYFKFIQENFHTDENAQNASTENRKSLTQSAIKNISTQASDSSTFSEQIEKGVQ